MNWKMRFSIIQIPFSKLYTIVDANGFFTGKPFTYETKTRFYGDGHLLNIEVQKICLDHNKERKYNLKQFARESMSIIFIIWSLFIFLIGLGIGINGGI